MAALEAIPIAEVIRLVEAHGGLRPRVFGSRARGDARPDSDLDLLVKAGPEMSLLDVVALQQDLEDLLGLEVHIVTEGGLHPLLRDRILAEARELVAA
jgi:predicted nucleotidyltransferase